jgi:IS605 OrfB family transposase
MPLADIAANIPAMFRRAAIHAALGAARSFQSNLGRWRKRREKAAARGRPFRERPPVPPRTWSKSVTFYGGTWKDRTDGRITLKLWDGQTWRWVRFRLSGRDLPEGWAAGSPQVVKRGRRFYLHTPVTRNVPRPEKAEQQLQDPHTRLCAVDLNVNDALAVCVILTADGTALATRFIRGGDELHGRRKSLLGRITRNRSRTGIIAEGEQDNAALWATINHLDEDTAHRVSRRIVGFAQAHAAGIIVFEHLGNLRPEKGRYSRRANTKRAYWLRGRIFQYTRYKAWAEGIITCRVSPRDTSRLCAVCGAEVARYGEGERPISYRAGAPLVLCPTCGMRGSADRNAGLNIGRRLLARYGLFHQEKPPPRPVWRGSPKGEGVSCFQDAESGARPHANLARPEAWDGHGTAREKPPGAAGVLAGIPRFLRVGGGGHAASTPEPAHAGVPKEAVAL